MEKKLRIIAISGDGIGAGKTTLANQLGTCLSLAGEMRRELSAKYPSYDWFNRDQSYKADTTITEMGGISMRSALLEYGQAACVDEPAYWARRLAARAECMTGVVTVDDLRKVVEIDYLRQHFPGAVTHIHISYPLAIHEPQFDNHKLEACADYRVVRRMSPADMTEYDLRVQLLHGEV